MTFNAGGFWSIEHIWSKTILLLRQSHRKKGFYDQKFPHFKRKNEMPDSRKAVCHQRIVKTIIVINNVHQLNLKVRDVL